MEGLTKGLAWLRNLKIREVSSVDRGAGEGVQVVMSKRDPAALALSGDGTPVEKAEEVKKIALGALDDIFNATYALGKSVTSIVEDSTIPDIRKSLEDTFGHFAAHVFGKDQGMSDIDAKKYAEAIEKAEKESEDAKKERDDAKKALRKVSTQLAISKMSDKHQSYMEDSDMDDDERDSFADKSPTERDAHMEKNPLEKRLSPVALRKRNENIEMSKRLDELTKRDDVTTFAKRAVDIGMPESFGATLRKARKPKDEKEREEAADEMEKTIKALASQVSAGDLFKEFGSSRGQPDAESAQAQVTAKAADLRKADTKLTVEAATTKVLTDPANADLFKRYRAETEGGKRAA